jgi:hypothetical protein
LSRHCLESGYVSSFGGSKEWHVSNPTYLNTGLIKVVSERMERKRRKPVGGMNREIMQRKIQSEPISLAIEQTRRNPNE